MDNFGTQATNDRQTSFAKRLTALNEQFLAWVKSQDTTEVWTDGAEDYLKYASDLLKDYNDVVNGIDSGFKANETSAFGIFEATRKTLASKPIFNFAANATAGFGGFDAPQTDLDDGDEADKASDEGPSIELDSSSANIFFSQRVALMSLHTESKKWKDRGTGTLTIRQSKEPSSSGSNASYLVFTTDSGRVLLNAPLVKGLKPIVNPKTPKNVIMMLISRVTPDGPEERGTQLFKCEDSEKAKTLLGHINEQI